MNEINYFNFLVCKMILEGCWYDICWLCADVAYLHVKRTPLSESHKYKYREFQCPNCRSCTHNNMCLGQMEHNMWDLSIEQLIISKFIVRSIFLFIYLTYKIDGSGQLGIMYTYIRITYFSSLCQFSSYTDRLDQYTISTCHISM
jgi:hypothetical protein